MLAAFPTRHINPCVSFVSHTVVVPLNILPLSCPSPTGFPLVTTNLFSVLLGPLLFCYSHSFNFF